MKIINKTSLYFKDKQLEKICLLLGSDYTPKRIIILDKPYQLLKYVFPFGLSFVYWQSLFCQVEGIYISDFDTVVIFVFAQNYEDYSKQDKKLYSIHALFHELRHRWQIKNNFNGDLENDADNFATKFLNNNSYKISKIMKFKHEWEVSEED